MPKVEIYLTPYCPYCLQAATLLQRKGVTFSELRVDIDPQLRQKMEELSGRSSVPQIFINDFHVGGCDDLYALEAEGKLDDHLMLGSPE